MHNYMAYRQFKNIPWRIKVIEDIITQINNKFGKESPPITLNGKVLIPRNNT